MAEKRTVPRKHVDFYLRVLNDDTQEILGHMVEVSEIGLRLETTAPVTVPSDYFLRLELTPDLGNIPYIVFAAQARWCKTDVIQPNLYRVGFKITEIIPEDKEIFQRILQKYGS